MKLPDNPIATWKGQDFAGSFWQSWLFDIWQFVTQSFGVSRSAGITGFSTLSAGTATVTATSAGMVAGSNLPVYTTGAPVPPTIIQLTYYGTTVNPGILSATSVVNGTSFVIHSSSGTDASTVSWTLIQPL